VAKPPLKTHLRLERPPFACVALLLQGGGALGAYQAGVYQGLAEANLLPDWIAGISIGAINAAIIAGNPPETRIDRLRAFWEGITVNPWYGDADAVASLMARGDDARQFFNQASAARTVVGGVPGFFQPRLPVPWLQPTGSREATSYYDTGTLRATLERLVDFDRINAAKPRFSVGAVNIRTGNFVYFDTATHHIGPEHIMASGALPPGFPPVEIEGESYWDGGLVSNTPLQWVLDCSARQDTLAFQVDLWNARGDVPGNMSEVMVREKEIQYSSRTRANTDNFRRQQKIRNALAAAVEKLPEELKALPEFAPLVEAQDRSVYNIVHLIYRARHYEGHAKDYEFSRLSMEEHWRTGHHDAVRTLRQPEICERPPDREGVFVFDVMRDGRD
jgi:NTE family protein